jgi:WD40 repeat protein
MLDATTGHVLFSMQIGATSTNTPFTVAVAHHAGRVFIVNLTGTQPFTTPGQISPGTVSILDAATGRLLRTTPVGIAPFAVAVSERTNRVFVPNNNYAARDPGTPGTISMLDATTRALLRTVTLPPQSPGPLTVNHPGPGPFSAMVDEQRSRVIVATMDGQVLILDARTGSVLQARKNIIPCVMALDQRRGYVIVQGGKGKGPEQRRVGSHIYVLDDRTGRTLHDTYIQGGLSNCLIRTVTVDQSRDTALVAAGLPESNGYTIYQIDVRTGRIVHTTNLYGNAVLGITAMVQDDQSRHVYLAFGTQLRVLDGADGHVLGTVDLPQPISTLGNIATVHPTGRLFVGDGYTDTIMVLDTRRLDSLLRGG